jgi:hypothetical protein
MALSFDELKQIIQGCGLQFFVHPTETVLMFGITGHSGGLQLTVWLLDNGAFLQMRTMGYVRCAAEAPHLPAVLRLLAELNNQYRLVKWGWDARNGEVSAFSDLFLSDALATSNQVSSQLFFFINLLDQVAPRIRATLDTGKDPGSGEPPRPPLPEQI